MKIVASDVMVFCRSRGRMQVKTVGVDKRHKKNSAEVGRDLVRFVVESREVVGISACNFTRK